MASHNRISVHTILGTIFIVLAVPFLIFAHAYPSWYQAEYSRKTAVESIGLWNICFPEEGQAAPGWVNDPFGNLYYGCNYMFDREVRSLRSWVYSGWFITVVFFVTFALIIVPIAFILNLIYYIRVCSPHYEHLLILASAIINFTNGFFIALAIIIFGLRSDTDDKWMPSPESCHLSWSFAVCAFVPVISFIASMFHSVDFVRLKSLKDRNLRVKTYSRGEFARY